jgi:hypothetical protein
MKIKPMRKKILLLLIFCLLFSFSCKTTEYIYLEPEVTEYPPVPELPELILNPTTKEDYRENTVLLAMYIKELQLYIDLVTIEESSSNVKEVKE